MDETGTVNVRGRRDFHANEDEEGCDDGRRGLAFLPPPSAFVLGRGVGWS